MFVLLLFADLALFVSQVAKAVASHLEVDPMMLQFFKGQV